MRSVNIWKSWIKSTWEFFVLFLQFFLSLKLFWSEKLKTIVITFFKMYHLGINQRLQEAETSVREGIPASAEHGTDINNQEESCSHLHWRNCCLVLGSGFEVRYLRSTTADTCVLMSYSSRKSESCECTPVRVFGRTQKQVFPATLPQVSWREMGLEPHHVSENHAYWTTFLS